MITLHTALQTLKSLLFNLQPHCPFQQRRLAACPNSAVMLMEDMSPKSSSRAPEPVKPERTPRQEEKWQKRESTLLDHVQFIIDDVGYAHFNMDRLVRASDVSKGTVYNHFTSKGIASLHSVAVGWKSSKICSYGRRHLMASLGKSLAIHYAYRLHEVASGDVDRSGDRPHGLRRKTSPQRAAKVRHNDETLFAVAFEVIDAAVRASDLEITEDLDATVITFLTFDLLWNQHVGGHRIRTHDQ